MKHIYSLVQYNNYDELQSILKSKNLNITMLSKNTEFIIPYAIKHRSKECFDLLVESKFFNPADENMSGIIIALEYFCNSPNDSNSYYLNILKNKPIIYSNKSIEVIISTGYFDNYEDIVLNFINSNPNTNIEYALSISLKNNNAFSKILNYGFTMNLINYNSFLYVIQIANRKEKFMVLTEFLNNKIDMFEDHNIMFMCFFENFHNTIAIKFIVDKLLLYNSKINFSNLLLDYFKWKEHVNNMSNVIFEKLYNIYINYSTLKRLKCDFFKNFDILSIMMDNFVFKTYYFSSTSAVDIILLYTKIIDLLISEKIIINGNTKLKNISNIPFSNISTYNKDVHYQYIKYLLDYINKYGINIDEFEGIINLQYRVQNPINIQNMLPKKLRIIKIW